MIASNSGFGKLTRLLNNNLLSLPWSLHPSTKAIRMSWLAASGLYHRGPYCGIQSSPRGPGGFSQTAGTDSPSGWRWSPRSNSWAWWRPAPRLSGRTVCSSSRWLTTSHLSRTCDSTRAHTHTHHSTQQVNTSNGCRWFSHSYNGRMWKVETATRLQSERKFQTKVIQVQILSTMAMSSKENFS